jgi:predicted flap endonuclease-1-like 5' DNA nuclease
MNHQTAILIAVVVAAILLLLLFLLRGRKQHVQFGADAPVPSRPAPSPAPPIAAADPVPPPSPDGHGLGDEVAAAVEDVVDQFMGMDSHPSGAPVASGDTLTLLKGLGPRAASRLTELGVTRFTQIASWDDTDVAAIDAQMGAFKGRIARDRWVEQARLLAAGERDAFEAQFGKLGGA